MATFCGRALVSVGVGGKLSAAVELAVELVLSSDRGLVLLGGLEISFRLVPGGNFVPATDTASFERLVFFASFVEGAEVVG